MATFSDCVQTCLEVRLVQALVSLWPDSETAATYWQTAVVPTLERMDYLPVLASLHGKKQTPSEGLLASLGYEASVQRLRDGEPLYRLLEEIMEAWRQDPRPIVLLLTGMERWMAARWRNDAAAFRSFLQTHEAKLFVVFVCTTRETLSRLFLSIREPLYREGMIVTIRADGTML